MPPVREEHAAAHVKLATADENFSLPPEQLLSIQHDSYTGPVGDWHQCGDRRIGIGHFEQASNVAARPRRPSQITEPSYPSRAPADRPRGAHAHEPVAERKTRFDRALTQHVVTLMA